MTNVHLLATANGDDTERRARIEKIARGLKDSVFASLSDEDSQDVLDKLHEILRPIPTPRAGEVLNAIVRLLPRGGEELTVQSLRWGVQDRGVSAGPKEVYNAVGYLVRKGYMRRVGYGRYVVADGTMIVTPDDLGGESAPHEDAYRVDD